MVPPQLNSRLGFINPGLTLQMIAARGGGPWSLHGIRVAIDASSTGQLQKIPVSPCQPKSQSGLPPLKVDHLDFVKLSVIQFPAPKNTRVHFGWILTSTQPTLTDRGVEPRRLDSPSPKLT